MIIIEKKLLVISLIISFISITASAIWAYNVGIASSLKGDSELVLFLGFIFAGIQLTLIINIIIHSLKKRRDFLTLMETIKSEGILSEKKIKKFGAAGVELQKALEAASKITAQKSLKIASLNGLMKILIEMIDSPVIIVNLNGNIIEASPKIKNEIDYSQDLNITDIFPEISVRKAFKEAALRHLPVEQGENILIPVFSTIGDIEYFLVDTSKQRTLSKFINNFIPSKKEDTSKKQKKI